MMGVGGWRHLMARPYKYDPTRVPAEPFADAFLCSGMSFTDLARAMGWFRNQTENRPDRTHKVHRRADGTKAARVLGLRTYTGGNSGAQKQYKNSTVSEEIAWKLLKIFPSLDPVDVGL